MRVPVLSVIERRIVPKTWRSLGLFLRLRPTALRSYRRTLRRIIMRSALETLNGKVMSRLLLVSVAIVAAGCGKSTTPLPARPPPGYPARSRPAPLSTFNLTGSVRDTVFRPLAAVQVAIVDGALAGRLTTSDADGRFAFTDLTPGTDMVSLSVTK